MIYKNTKEDRDRIVESINILQAEGYSRKDYPNQKIILEKVALKGKICKKVDIIEFIFIEHLKEIYRMDSQDIIGLNNLKSLLFGFSSPAIECENALKAGLISKRDIEIYKSNFTSEEWLNV
jgi:hypothetical protein